MANHLDLEEQEQIEQLKAFWARFGNLITLVLVLIFGAFAAWNGYQYWQRQQSAQASTLSDEVSRLAQAGDFTTAQRAFGELSTRFPRTVYAQHAALEFSQLAVQAKKSDLAKDALRWAAEHGTDSALASVARLRWAGLLIDAKDWKGASAALESNPADPEFLVPVLDRRGDALAGSGDKAAAIEAYKKAFESSGSKPEVQRMIRIKLNGLGVDVEPIVK